MTESEAKLSEYVDIQRIPNPIHFGDPNTLPHPLVKELALHLIRSCLDPDMDPDKRFRWAHQVVDENLNQYVLSMNHCS